MAKKGEDDRPENENAEKKDPPPPAPAPPEKNLWKAPQFIPQQEQEWKHQERSEQDHHGEGQRPEGAQEERPEAGREKHSDKAFDQAVRRSASRSPRGTGGANEGHHNLGYGNVHAAGAHGPNLGNIGRDLNNFILTGAVSTPRNGHYDARHLDGIAARHVSSAEEDRLVAMLRDGGMAVLNGESMSGRRTTALRCLDRLMGETGASERKVSILRCGEDLTVLHDQAEAAGHGPCFVLDATGATWPRTVDESEFRSAFSRFDGVSAWIVVLVDEPSPAGHMLPLSQAHARPSPEDVLRNHLADLMAPRYSDPVERAADLVHRVAERLLPDASGTASWIAFMACPDEAAVLASTIDLWDRGEAEDLDEKVLERRRVWLDHRARALLSVTDPERSPRDQANVLASAVLDGMPESRISAAAEVLVEVLEEGDRSPTKAPIPFSEPSERRLRHMREREDAPGLWLAQPGLGPALLHAAWFDHPRTNDRMITWLVRLCDGDTLDGEGRILAGRALAQLAGYDEETVLKRTVGAWSETTDGRTVQRAIATSRLLEQLVLNQSPEPDALDGAPADDPRLQITASVAERLRDWTDPYAFTRSLDDLTSTEHHHRFFLWTAALVTYGTYACRVRPVRDDLRNRLRNAARVTRRTRMLSLLDQKGAGPALAQHAENTEYLLTLAANNAYCEGARTEVLREVVRWSAENDPDMVLLACRILLKLADVRREPLEDDGAGAGAHTPVDDDARPFDLLLWLSSGDDVPEGVRQQTLRLWIIALSHESTSRAAWRALFRWDIQAGIPVPDEETGRTPDRVDGANGPMRAYLTDLFEEIYTRPQLRHLRPALDRYHLLRARIEPEQFPSGGHR